jgi:enediyne biosynthesis protein E4
MTRWKKQALVLALLAVELAALWRVNHDTRHADLDTERALAAYGFYLRECAKECGIDFVHEKPKQLDEKLRHIGPIVASTGAGVSIVDFDRDGWPDIYVVTSVEGGKNRLYRNLGNGKFADVAGAMGVADLNIAGTGVCQGAVWGDYDNDGFEDLLVYKWGRPELFHNDGGKGFTRVTERAGLPATVNAGCAIWLDYDRDGHLDLLLAGYWPDDIDLWKLTTTKMMPESFEYATNGGRKYLLRNKGDGTFEDVTASVGITSKRWTLAAVAADLCGSGYPDLVLANDYGVSEFYANKGGERFEEVGNATEIGKTPKSGMNASLGDPFNSGRLSLYVSNISVSNKLQQGNNLWVPMAHKAGEAPRYLNMARELRIEAGGWSWGAQFGDLNNDGYQELYLTNGYISADPADSYWYEYGLLAGGNRVIISDAQNWPPIRNRSLAGRETKCLWWNRNGEFANVAQQVGVRDTFDGRAVAMADLWNRGVLDVVVANQAGPLLVYKNTVRPGNDWIQFELEGTRGNRSAIGAQVRVFWTAEGSDRVREQVQAVTGGVGYAAQNMRRLHFGLGKGARIQRAEIAWPSGHTETVTELSVGTVHRRKEPAS